MNKIEIQEMISALADGQLRGDQFARAVEAVAADPETREAWHAYHVIGDVLRSGELASSRASGSFVEGIRLQLANEPGFAIDLGAPDAQREGATTEFGLKPRAANDASFRWKMVAGLASFAAVAAIGWTVLGSFGARPEQPQMAAVPAASGQVLASGAQGTMLRDARLDELLAAHRQLGGGSALQMPAGLLRNATFEGPAR